jgi:hypothetical protein
VPLLKKVTRKYRALGAVAITGFAAEDGIRGDASAKPLWTSFLLMFRKSEADPSALAYRF